LLVEFGRTFEIAFNKAGGSLEDESLGVLFRTDNCEGIEGGEVAGSLLATAVLQVPAAGFEMNPGNLWML
jgi:hypothetical protein